MFPINKTAMVDKMIEVFAGLTGSKKGVAIDSQNHKLSSKQREITKCNRFITSVGFRISVQYFGSVPLAF